MHHTALNVMLHTAINRMLHTSVYTMPDTANNRMWRTSMHTMLHTVVSRLLHITFHTMPHATLNGILDTPIKDIFLFADTAFLQTTKLYGRHYTLFNTNNSESNQAVLNYNFKT